MLTKIKPKAGNLLISEPFMLDDNFKRSVILLVESSENGDIGYVLNYKGDLLLKDILEECWDANFNVFVGGPVGENTLNFIHSCPDKIYGGVDLGNGLFWGGDFEMVIAKINNYAIKEEEIKFFIGYSGWIPNQLEDELISNTWMVSDSFNPELVLDNSDHDIWKESIINMGERFAHVANFPEDPQLN